MNKQLFDKWIEALRSGEYKQGTSCLHADDRFCCLGVLWDVHSGSDWHETDEGFLRSTHYGIKYENEECTLDLNSKIRKLLGLSMKQMNKLIEMNDGDAGADRASFNEIADYLERKRDKIVVEG